MPNVPCEPFGQVAPVSSFNAGYPAGVIPGNILVAVVAMSTSGLTTTPITQTGPDPWVLLAQTPVGSFSTAFGVFVCIVPGGFTSATFSTAPDAGSWAVNIGDYYNVDTGNPIDVANPSINIFSSESPSVIATAPSITTTIQNTRLLYCVSTVDVEGVFADLEASPPGMTLQQSGQSSFLPQSQVAIHDEPFAPIGATGTRAQTIAKEAGKPVITAFNFLLALRPFCIQPAAPSP